MALKFHIEQTQLRDFRKRCGVSRAHIARLVGVCDRTVSRWEAGTHPISMMDLQACYGAVGLAVLAEKRAKRARQIDIEEAIFEQGGSE